MGIKTVASPIWYMVNSYLFSEDKICKENWSGFEVIYRVCAFLKKINLNENCNSTNDLLYIERVGDIYQSLTKGKLEAMQWMRCW